MFRSGRLKEIQVKKNDNFSTLLKFLAGTSVIFQYFFLLLCCHMKEMVLFGLIDSFFPSYF